MRRRVQEGAGGPTGCNGLHYLQAAAAYTATAAALSARCAVTLCRQRAGSKWMHLHLHAAVEREECS